MCSYKKPLLGKTSTSITIEQGKNYTGAEILLLFPFRHWASNTCRNKKQQISIEE
jgi:hypothetical protein